MKRFQLIPLSSLIGLLVLSACSSTGGVVTPAADTAPPQPTVTEVKALPTPASPGDSITWRDLQVSMDQIEITQEFVNEFGSARKPPAGMKFMWVHVQLRNAGPIEIDTPRLENFSVLYAGTELKPTYGHRQGYKDYSTLAPKLFPEQEADGWIRIDIPAAAELTDMLCVFIPQSAQIGTSITSPNYPYAEGKPTFVWKCAP